MRRLFIIRKDLHMTTGKLSAMLAHCAEGYWTRLISNSLSGFDTNGNAVINLKLDKSIFENYIGNSFVKTICEAKNLNHLMKVETIAKELGLVENEDYGFIDDLCLTELTPEFVDEQGNPRCRVGVWFKPLDDEVSFKLSKKYQLFKR